MLAPGQTGSDEMATPPGDCYEASVKFIQDPTVVEWPDDYRLVHGNVAKLNQAETVNHAWIEEGDVVHEVSNGRQLAFLKDDYYKKYKITNVRKYTVLEALELCARHGHFGPWD